MKRRQKVCGLAASGALAAGLIWYQPGVAGQAPAQAAALPIQSLSEPDQGFAIRQVAPQSGYATFASSPDQGILLPLPAGAPAEARALGFVDAYGKAFGLADSSQVRLMAAPQADVLGLEHVRLQQVHKGVPVRAGEFVVHLKGSRAMAANGHITNDLPDNVVPGIPANAALTEARQLIEKRRPEAAPGAQYSDPRLEIFNRSLLSDPVSYGSRLAWFVEATGETLREYIWVDAQSGVLLLNFSQLADAKLRTVYTAGHTNTLPGTLVRIEGGAATGDADQDNAYDYAGVTYDYYLANHGRDSFDNAGGTLISTAHYCTPTTCPSYENAFWNGTQMVYGDGFSSADDVVAHELTHAVTERTAGLLYYVQSGALNESFSDIFGETVDLTDGVGVDDTPGVRWRMGEDLSIGAIRDMMTPTTFSDPGKMSDSAFFKCSNQAWDDPNADRGGVHTNSGIPNHAYALMADGGTYNGRTVTGIGLTKAGKIQYRALSTYLTSGAGFLDNYNALNQSCTDLIGTAGITSGDCTQVTTALQAVEMNSTWGCAGATPAPAVCPAGTPSYTSNEGFESGAGNWTASTSGAGTWSRIVDFAKTGEFSEWGTDAGSVSDHRLSMTSAAVMPAGARLYFDHAFEFENDIVSSYDAGVLEYSTDGGTAWTDAASFIDAGQGYGGTVSSCCTNPLGGRSAFVRSSFGYTATRLNLASLAGQSVKFRFRVGTDSSVSSLGWLVDNVAIYACGSGGGGPFTDDPLIVSTTPIKRVHITEMQTRIDAVRTSHTLGGFAWRAIAVDTTTILAQDIIDLRTALDEAYDQIPLSHFSYSRSIGPGQTIQAADITETRAALAAVE